MHAFDYFSFLLTQQIDSHSFSLLQQFNLKTITKCTVQNNLIRLFFNLIIINSVDKYCEIFLSLIARLLVTLFSIS